VDVNCATIRGDAAMSALFGHVKGAFTGAQKDRAGLLRAADKGVLFLDEIGELGIDEQAMLLRALEEKTFLPLGSDEEAHSDFQLIAGTNRDLFAAVREGKFREDLLARINLWTFLMPGLKNRTEDIEPNLDFELDRFAEKAGRRVTFIKEARERFLDFALSRAAAWSGNFRDLNAAEFPLKWWMRKRAGFLSLGISQKLRSTMTSLNDFSPRNSWKRSIFLIVHSWHLSSTYDASSLPETDSPLFVMGRGLVQLISSRRRLSRPARSHSRQPTRISEVECGPSC